MLIDVRDNSTCVSDALHIDPNTACRGDNELSEIKRSIIDSQTHDFKIEINPKHKQFIIFRPRRLLLAKKEILTITLYDLFTK